MASVGRESVRISPPALAMRKKKKGEAARPRRTGLEELRNRLQLAEDTLRAIRAGEVDAVVVGKAKGERVVTLAGAELPYKLMLDQMYEGAVTLDPDCVIAYGNRRFADIVRTPITRVIGVPVTRFVSTADRPALEALCREAAGYSTRGEFTFRGGDGSAVAVSVSLAPLQLEGSVDPIGVIGLVTDMTERKRAAEVLRQSEERFRLIVESVRDYAIFMLDPGGHVVSWNLGAQRLKGYRAVEILGQHFSRFYPEEDIERGKPAQELVVAAAEGRLEDEGWRVRKNGTRFWANVVITALRDQTGTLRGFAKVTRDVTERKRAEELRARLTRQLLVAQDAERRRIARELHDETGQALTGLLVGLRTIERSQSIAEAVELAQQLRGVVAQSLVDVSRLARGLHPSILDDVGLSAAVTRYVEEFAQLHGIAVDLQIGLDSDRLPLLVQTTVYRVLQEALTNVAKHAGGRHASVRLAREKATIELKVQDDGPGIKRRRAPGRAARSHRGGLGLEGMRERVALLGGSVRIESEPGAGTTVTARIPVQSALLPESDSGPVKAHRDR
jgi:PAS domain S-box-containing protein